MAQIKAVTLQTPVSLQKTKSVFMDEEMMTRVYGKASYQKGRTTVKDPYLHFQNTAKQKAPRPVGTTPVKGKPTENMPIN